LISKLQEIYYWYATAGTAIFMIWLWYISPRVKGPGKTRNCAITVGIIFLVALIAPDIWSLTRLEGISWFVAWSIGLLLTNIFQAGIWQRICWGDKCPKCGAWIDVYDEPVPGNPNMARRTGKCPRCGWTDSWTTTVKKNRDQ